MENNQYLENEHQYVTLNIGNQLFGLPVLEVYDVLRDQKINPIPLAPQQVAGSLNLRGRIVTAIDMRKRLAVQNEASYESEAMNVVVQFKGEMYSLIVDRVGEVMTFTPSQFEKTPAVINPIWRNLSKGIIRLESNLMIILDVERIFIDINTDSATAA
ncbi:MAG: chemotaxis protein CheW [Holosporales bacterium]|jgi:purine-binding chemotaxis protein CheW